MVRLRVEVVPSQGVCFEHGQSRGVGLWTGESYVDSVVLVDLGGVVLVSGLVVHYCGSLSHKTKSQLWFIKSQNKEHMEVREEREVVRGVRAS